MDKSQRIIKQASILALAGIIVRIIGVLYRSPLTAMIGDKGNGYYSTAYNIYSMILLISSYSIPTAISKLISEKLVLKQYNNAQKIFKCALIYVAVIGGVAALLAFILAPYLVIDGSVFALRILCPTIFLSGLVGVLRGYFQAHSTTFYTSVSQILEQIFNAVISIMAAYMFIAPYLGEGADLNMKASQGAGGSAMGTGAGVLIALVFLVFSYYHSGRMMDDRTDEDPRVDSGVTILKSILNIVTPIIFSTCVYNLVTVIDMSIFYGLMGMRGVSQDELATLYGVYSGKYVVLMNVPVALASAMSAASVPEISGAHAMHDHKALNTAIEDTIAVTMMVLIPSAVGLAVLSYPIMGLLFPQKETIMLASTTLRIGACATVFYGLSTISNGILQAIGHAELPLRNAVLALIVHVVLMALMLVALPIKYLDLSLYLLAIGTSVYALQMCITNQTALRKIIKYKYKLGRIFLIPLMAAAVMGVVVFGAYELLFGLTRRVFIPLMASVAIGVIVYFALIIFFYKGNEKKLLGIPGMTRILSALHRI